ncbi:MAG TPA: hypothetical protein DCL77_08940 [Prolixibacteraceae bacterium]|jgi:hypothetical protein|nr:hypothetical protein [Prolixibacteraceae bacterium]
MNHNYILSYCILDSNFAEFIKYLPYYSSFKMKAMPRAWEEPLAIYILKTKTVPGFVNDQTVSKGCIQRLTAFNKTMKQFHNDVQAAKNTLRGNFENTYWYYMLYLNPKVTHILDNKAPVQ